MALSPQSRAEEQSIAESNIGSYEIFPKIKFRGQKKYMASLLAKLIKKLMKLSGKVQLLTLTAAQNSLFTNVC